VKAMNRSSSRQLDGFTTETARYLNSWMSIQTSDGHGVHKYPIIFCLNTTQLLLLTACSMIIARVLEGQPGECKYSNYLFKYVTTAGSSTAT